MISYAKYFDCNKTMSFKVSDNNSVIMKLQRTKCKTLLMTIYIQVHLMNLIINLIINLLMINVKIVI